MIEVHTHPDLTPWKPTPTELPEEWIALSNALRQETKGSQHTYVLKVRYDAQRVGDLLRSWGLPWQVVMAGYLWEYDKAQIGQANLHDVDQVLNHINEANLYARYIEEENLPPLLAPPYRDLGALLIAVAIYYQALQTLQEQSNERPYTGAMQSHIESVGRTLLNIAKSLGMWHFKRNIEDVIEQLRSPRKFAEAKQEHARILEQDAMMLEDTRQWLIRSFQEATKQPILVIYTPCGIRGMKRRLQDADTTAISHKTQFTGFDLVTYDVIVPTVQDCYTAFGVLSQLGHIRDRVIEQIANPKPNGYSHIAFELILKPQGPYTQGLKWPKTYTRICQLQIATHLMQAITWYGCLHPSYYQLCGRTSFKEELEPPSVGRLWSSEEGKVFFAIKELFAASHPRPETRAPIIVYDKNRKSIALPKGATALDFAYALNKAIGEHAVEAFINNRQAPLYRILDAGDIVEIRTAREAQVDDYWLDNAITPVARRQIKESLNQRFLDRRGYNLLRQTLERYHFILAPEDLDHELQLLLKQHNLGTPQHYLERLEKTGEPPYTPEWAAQEIMQQIAERNEPLSIDTGRSSWVPILDIQLSANKKFIHQQRLCNFCQPTYPRDIKITGRLRRRSGELVVHKASCPHLIDRTNGHKSVLLPMIWQLQPPAFRIAFFVIAQDRKGLILDLTRQLRRHECDLLSIKAEAILKFREAHIRFTIETHDDKEVLDIWQELYHIENVTKAEIDAAATPAPIRERLQKLREQHTVLPDKADIGASWEESLAILPPRSPILKNPFDISRPATAERFYGRSEETKMMQRELCDSEQGKALILYGPRRSGKSSICKNFLESQVKPPYWGVLFSLQNTMQETEETILIQLADEVCRQFHEQLQRPAPDWQQYSNSDPQIRFKRILQDCIVQVPGTRLVLALDEFGGALDSYENQILEQRFFIFWKDLMNEIPQLSLILALPSSAHSTLSSKKFANTFSFAQPLPVQFLDTESAKQLLVDPLQDQHIAIHPNTVALAVTLTGGSPYYMTLIGQQLIQQLNRDPNKQVVNDKDLRLVVEHFIESGSNNQNFAFLRRELQNNYELSLLETMVEITSNTTQPEVQLKKIAGRLNLPLPVVRRYLDRLRNGLILQENGPSSNPYYSFAIELVRRWLMHNRWFFSPLSTN